MNQTIGLHKEVIRRIVLDKLAVVYRDWNFDEPPFADFATMPGERRDDGRAFLIALVAGLLGGVSEAIERNNQALAAALDPQHRDHCTQSPASGRLPRRRRRR
jgi:hypothetical protein